MVECGLQTNDCIEFVITTPVSRGLYSLYEVQMLVHRTTLFSTKNTLFKMSIKIYKYPKPDNFPMEKLSSILIFSNNHGNNNNGNNKYIGLLIIIKIIFR